jgi:hypothetical protein
MPKKVTIKAHRLIASKSVNKTTKSGSLSQKNSSKTLVGRSSVSGEFVSAKTGRIIKTSPAKPRLGRERIQTAVRNYVRRDDGTGKFAD